MERKLKGMGSKFGDIGTKQMEFKRKYFSFLIHK